MKQYFGCANEGDAEIVSVLHISCMKGRMNLTADVAMNMIRVHVLVIGT